MTHQAKRIKAWTGDRNLAHAATDAVKLVKENAKAKFDESVEIAVNLGVDPRHADQQVRSAGRGIGHHHHVADGQRRGHGLGRAGMHFVVQGLSLKVLHRQRSFSVKRLWRIQAGSPCKTAPEGAVFKVKTE